MNNIHKIKLNFIFCILIFLVGCKLNPHNNSTENLPSESTQSGGVILDNAGYKRIKADQVTHISEIQGAGHISPLNRKVVDNVFGVVTALKSDGFYIQSVYPDTDLRTSEAIYIFLNAIPSIRSGDWVLVNGKIDEFYPGGLGSGNLSITEITQADVLIVSRGNQLPSATILGMEGRSIPNRIIDDDKKKKFELTDGLDFYESLESMLVQVNNAICVGPTSSYNEFVVLADNGQYASGMNERNGITISEDDFNPERIMIDDGLSAQPIVDVGDTFSKPIVGILDYSFGNFKIQPFKKLIVNKNYLQYEVASPSKKDSLTIASMNLENLSAIDSNTRFEKLANIIVNNLQSPSIIGVQEIQDNNGVVDDNETDASETYKKIIEFVQKAGGPVYSYTEITPSRDRDGGEPGGNIRVGFLYQANSDLQLVENNIGKTSESVEPSFENNELVLSVNPGRIATENYVFADSRKSLIAEFVYNDHKLFIINNHWVSKGGDTPLFGNVQPPILLSENQREGQAKVIANFITKMLELEPESNIIALGDFNDFYFSSPLKVMQTSGMINLIFNLPINERYTYNYEGNSQNLDNFLVTSSLKSYVTDIDIVHCNSEYSFNESFSDHDPILVTLEFN